MYEQHVVIDFEFTPIPKIYTEERKIIKNEIIQIGAVLLDSNYKQIDTFTTYVKPTYATKISSHVYNLTGITKKDLRNAPSLKDALYELVLWIDTRFKTCIYSWSDTDLKQLRNECLLKEITFPQCMANWTDLQLVYEHMICFPQKLSLRNAIMLIDGNFSSSLAHTALYDALVTTELLILTTCQEEFFKRTQNARELFMPKKSTYTIGDLCALKLAQFII